MPTRNNFNTGDCEINHKFNYLDIVQTWFHRDHLRLGHEGAVIAAAATAAAAIAAEGEGRDAAAAAAAHYFDNHGRGVRWLLGHLAVRDLLAHCHAAVSVVIARQLLLLLLLVGDGQQRDPVNKRSFTQVVLCLDPYSVTDFHEVP